VSGPEVTPQPEVVGLEGMIERNPARDGTDPLTALTVDLMNLLVDGMGNLRCTNPGFYDGPLIAALVLYAGSIQGELLALGMTREINTKATTKMLLANWQSGIIMGKAKIERVRAEVQANCPGHVASKDDPKVCGLCGTHVDAS
jgi:hypothetical protein